MKSVYPIAVYFDLENIDSKLNLSKLMESIMLEANSADDFEQDGVSPIFAIKMACGNTNAIAKFRNQLGDLNFEIREAVHVANKKNRADLILSLEAFESLYQKSPDVSHYVFITSDTDFTVVMDKLHKYGKKVWLVTRKEDAEKSVFTSCSDKILSIEDYFDEKQPKNEDKLLQFICSQGFSKTDGQKMVNVLESFEKDQWIFSSLFGTKLHSIAKDFSYKGKTLNSQGKFLAKLKEKKIIEIKKDGKQEWFKIV